MTGPNLAYFRARFAAMDEEELVTLYARAAHQPEKLADVAREALLEVVAERGLDVGALLHEQAEAQAADGKATSRKRALAASKKKIRTRVLGKALGFAGLVTSAVILIPSLYQAHTGGVLAAVATAGCSLWLLFRYQGD